VEKSPLINAELSPGKPFFEYGTGETAHSLAWFNSSPHVLAVSCNSKSIRCIDIRGDYIFNINLYIFIIVLKLQYTFLKCIKFL